MDFISTLATTATTRTPTITPDLRLIPEAGASSGRPRGPEWVGRGPAAAGIPELSSPSVTGRVVEAGVFAGRRCGPEFIGAGPGSAGLTVLDPAPGAYTAPAAFGEIGRMATL